MAPQIKERLTNAFPQSEVLFSEDLADVPPDSPDLSLPERELYHLTACDICVILDTSVGAAAEIAHFTRSEQAKKLVILTHERYKGAASFAGALRELGYQIFYSQYEYDTCNLIASIVTRVYLVALARASKLL